jgi:deoxyribodipyrimidine photo-lyase
MTKNQNQSQKNSISIWWIKNDLRLNFNESLNAAKVNPELILPVYIYNENDLNDADYVNSRAYSFLYHGLKQIEKQIELQGGRLLQLKSNNPAKSFKELSDKYQIKKIYVTGEFTNEFKEQLNQLYDTFDVQVYYDNLVNPKTHLNQTGTAYKVFTQFANQWKNKNTKYNLSTINKFGFTKIDEINDDIPIPSYTLNQLGEFLPGEDNATKIFANFIDNKIHSYKDNRDYLYIDGTSKLSPYIKFGMISIKQIYNTCLNLPSSKGVGKWVDELLWREFYLYINHYFPQSINTEFQEKYSNFQWKQDLSLFNKWKYGETGFPIVDACMKQLINTGWMHNRGRMIVASFLTKDLLIDWRMGEKWFMQNLIDGDRPSNVGGWQWTAGCGVDAAPYFRIFNPILQSKKFDPNAIFIKKWIPELQNVEIKFAHEPWLSNESIYRPKIVDHYEARKKTLELFKSYNE